MRALRVAVDPGIHRPLEVQTPLPHREAPEDRRRGVTHPWLNDAAAPLALHARYRRAEVLAALGVSHNGAIPTVQGGVFHVTEANTDLLFVTLEKNEKAFSPKTRCRDFPVSPALFHRESQHTAHPDTPAGRRYLEGSSRVLLFVRQRRKLANGIAEPFAFLGPVTLPAARAPCRSSGGWNAPCPSRSTARGR